MPDIQVSERLISFLLFIPIFLISLAVHEFAHAYFANQKGDSTAKDLGRMTLNPIKHLDLVGSIIMPIASFASGFILIGWAKPVPVNRNNFKNPHKDDVLVSFAGPASNILLALLFAISFSFFIQADSGQSSMVSSILWYGVIFNVFLFAFNLLPIPPLDGSHILYNLFPNKLTLKLLNLGIYGSILLLVFIYSPLWKYFFDVVKFIINILFTLVGVKYEM